MLTETEISEDEGESSTETEVELHVTQFTESLPLSEIKSKQIAALTKEHAYREQFERKLVLKQ